MKKNKIELVEQYKYQEVVYSIEQGESPFGNNKSVKLKRFWDDYEEGKKDHWGEWFIDRDDKVYTLPETIDEIYVEAVLKAFKKAKREIK